MDIQKPQSVIGAFIDGIIIKKSCLLQFNSVDKIGRFAGV